MGFDYSYFIVKLNELDDDADCALSETQFYQLLHDMPISSKDGFAEVAYNGLKEKNKRVPFQSIRNLYESSQTNFHNKPMLLILYRGVSVNKEMYLNKDEYLQIAYLAVENFDKDLYKQKFDDLADKDTIKIHYKDVALSAFGIRVSAKDDPFTEHIQIRSPHSACCLLI